LSIIGGNDYELSVDFFFALAQETTPKRQYFETGIRRTPRRRSGPKGLRVFCQNRKQLKQLNLPTF
jgi:hypothetical protein